jgi:hypothetical protein
MLKKWAFICFMIVLTALCDSIISSKPSGTLNESEMTDILVDIHLTEATLRISNDSLARLNDTTNLRIRFAQVFRNHGIKPDDFNKSLNYYLEHIELLDKIYTDVISRLSVMEANLIQKTATPSFNKVKSLMLKPGFSQLRNPWFRTIYKPEKPAEIQYFSPSVYPVESDR